MITEIFESPLKNKRYRVLLDNGEHYDFGLKEGETYLDHHDKTKRMNYQKRHLGNKIENFRITNGINSPSLFSFYLLWGPSTDLKENIEYLNTKFPKR